MRRVKIYYYLEDDTISVVEPPVENRWADDYSSWLQKGAGLVCAVQLAIWMGGGAGVCSAASCLDRGWGWCVQCS